MSFDPSGWGSGNTWLDDSTSELSDPFVGVGDDLFLRQDLPANKPLLETSVPVELQPGDALFFHARCFHAATRNFSNETKKSVVFTFRSLDNSPLPGTRSSEMPELLLS